MQLTSSLVFSFPSSVSLFFFAYFCFFSPSLYMHPRLTGAAMYFHLCFYFILRFRPVLRGFLYYLGDSVRRIQMSLNTIFAKKIVGFDLDGNTWLGGIALFDLVDSIHPSSIHLQLLYQFYDSYKFIIFYVL